MARSKDYKSKKIRIYSGFESEEQSKESCIHLPENPKQMSKVDFGPFLRHGIDDWIWDSTKVLNKYIQSGQYEVSTIGTWASSGLRSFFRFLIENKSRGVATRPSDIKPEDVTRYIEWLKDRYSNGHAAKTTYSSVKSVLIGLIEFGFITTSKEALLPLNALPLSKNKVQNVKPLSQAEVKQLATALRKDLISIYHGTFRGLDAEAIVVLMLIIGMRSGLNTASLLEITRDCLQPHPFMPNLMLIKTIKRRSKRDQSTTLRQTQANEYSATIPMDGVAVINMALKITEPLAAAASQEIKNQLWLFRSSLYGEKGKPLKMKVSSLYQYIKLIVQRHGLLSDDGSNLRVTFGRLRKTMEQRLWKLSDGDIQAVATVMGHTPSVADNYYLHLDEDAKAEGAKFIGEVLSDKLRGINLEATPTGRCKDSLYGAKAPKNGSSHCAEFTHCLSCPSYAIVGSVKDLHRLFSYQLFLKSEIEYYSMEEWKEWISHHQIIIAQIDQIANQNFPLEMVREAKGLAEMAPHKFWEIRLRQSHLIRGSRHAE